MSVRIRANRSVIVCGARSEPEDSDCYLDDNVHGTLCEMHRMKWIGVDENWADLWAFCEPKDFSLSPVSEMWWDVVREQRRLHPMCEQEVKKARNDAAD